MKDLKDLDDFALTSPSLQSNYLSKSQSIIMAAFKEANHKPKEILSLNENWATIFLKEQGLSVTLLSEARNNKKYDTVLALDETLCRFSNENAQKQAVLNLLNLLEPQGLMLVSLRDYRNGNFHRRPLGDTVLNELDGEDFITVEVNQHQNHDKQAWYQKMYLIKNHQELQVIDCGDRRTLYFKQLAKYINDHNQTNKFGIFKEIFWRGTWRRTPEHIAWIKKQ